MTRNIIGCWSDAWMNHRKVSPGILPLRYLTSLTLLAILIFGTPVAHAQTCTPACTAALASDNKNPNAVDRATSAISTLTSAANDNGIPVDLLAAIGVMESGFLDVNENHGANVGVGVFQLTVSPTSGVTTTQANNLTTAAGIAASMLSANMNAIAAKCTNFNNAQLLLATAATYNMGLGGPNLNNVTCNPSTIDVGTNGPNHTKNDFGTTVMALTNCFGSDSD